MIPIALLALSAALVAGGADEPLRPRYHFTARTGYLNDPNGLFVRDGTFHLFFQHGDIRSKSWGHATSADLFRWTQHRDALTPVDGHPVFSGCAVIDTHNTSGPARRRTRRSSPCSPSGGGASRWRRVPTAARRGRGTPATRC